MQLFIIVEIQVDAHHLGNVNFVLSRLVMKFLLQLIVQCPMQANISFSSTSFTCLYHPLNSSRLSVFSCYVCPPFLTSHVWSVRIWRVITFPHVACMWRVNIKALFATVQRRVFSSDNIRSRDDDYGCNCLTKCGSSIK